MKKILIIRLGAIGDVVHSTIIPQAIKDKYPEVECHFLTTDFIAPLIENCSYLDKVFKLDNNKKDNFFYLLSLGLKLRKENYNSIINLTNSSRNIFLSFLAAPKKIIKRSKYGTHAVEAFFNTGLGVFSDLELPTNLKLTLSKDLPDIMLPKLAPYKKPFIVLSPGGDNDILRQVRIWPMENWIELGCKLQKKSQGTIFIVGSKSERKYHEICQKIPNSVIFSGELSLKESAFLFSLADLFVSGDSGPLHIASGFETHTIAILGSTDTVAYGDNSYKVEPSTNCRYCNQKKCSNLKKGEIYTPCISSISPQDVLNLIEEKNLLN